MTITKKEIQPSKIQMFKHFDPKSIPSEDYPSAYESFWENEKEKVKNGIEIDGYKMSGWLYWHLNHWKLGTDDPTDPNNINADIITITPNLRDNEFIINDALIKAEDRREGICIMGLRQMGKDLLNSSLLYQEDKEITIGDCSIGDKIYDESGNLTTIIGKFPQGIKPVYELTLVDGRKINCGLEHNWYVWDRIRKKHLIKTTKELMVDYKMYRESWKNRKNSYEFRYYIENNQPVKYKEKQLKLDPYILGAWLGDGHCNTTSITNIDKEILNAFQEFSDSRDLKMINYDRDSYRINTGVKNKRSTFVNTFLKDLQELNLINNKHIPEEYFYSSVEQRLELLRGLMDTDGWCDKRGTIGFCTTSEILSKQFYKLCRSLGIPLTQLEYIPECTYKGQKVKGKKAYKFNLFTDLPIFKVKRKLFNIKKTNKIYLHKVPISNIEYKFDAETTCITVDNDSHLFLTDNYTPTHNTSFMSSYGGRSGSIFKNSQNLIMGTSSEDLNNITQNLDFGLSTCTPYFRIPKITQDWGKERVLLGVKQKSGENKIWSTYVIRNTIGGKKTEKGAGVSNLKCNLWDEIGKDDFLSALNATKPAMLSANGWRTIPIATGTGGNVVKAQDAKKLFFNPKANNFLEFEQEDGSITGLYMPGWLRQDCKYKTTLAQYLLDIGRLTTIPKDSELWLIDIEVSNKEEAIKKINQELEALKEAGDTVEYNRWKAYYPLCIDDIFLSESHNNFPVDACKAQKKWLESNYTPEYVHLFRNQQNKVEFKYSDEKPIDVWNVSAKDLLKYGKTPLVVFEHPDPDAPFATYCIGIDPYNENESSDKINSLGSIYVYKRYYKPGDCFAKKYVASWTGRCKTVGEFHELCLMIMEYYNAIESVLPENEDKTMIQYVIMKRKGVYFAKSLDLSKQINPNSKSNRTIGLSAATPNQKHYMSLLVEYAKEEIETIDENGLVESYLGVSNILDTMLLEEMICYKGKDSSSRGVHDGNYDRLIAAGHAITLAKYYDALYPLEGYRPKPTEPLKPEIKVKTAFGDIVPKKNSPFRLPSQRTPKFNINW